jgi:hypothetical protein
MVQTRSGEAVGNHPEPQEDLAALARSIAQHDRTKRSDLARVDRLERIAKQIAHLTKASDRLALAPIAENVALPAMDRINYEIETLTYEQRRLQVDEDLSLADALDLAQRRTMLLEATLALPDEAIPEVMWALYDEVDGDAVAFAEAFGLEPSNPDSQYLFSLVHSTIGDRP